MCNVIDFTNLICAKFSSKLPTSHSDIWLNYRSILQVICPRGISTNFKRPMLVRKIVKISVGHIYWMFELLNCKKVGKLLIHINYQKNLYTGIWYMLYGIVYTLVYSPKSAFFTMAIAFTKIVRNKKGLRQAGFYVDLWYRKSKNVMT